MTSSVPELEPARQEHTRVQIKSDVFTHRKLTTLVCLVAVSIYQTTTSLCQGEDNRCHWNSKPWNAHSTYIPTPSSKAAYAQNNNTNTATPQ